MEVKLITQASYNKLIFKKIKNKFCPIANNHLIMYQFLHISLLTISAPINTAGYIFPHSYTYDILTAYKDIVSTSKKSLFKTKAIFQRFSVIVQPIERRGENHQ